MLLNCYLQIKQGDGLPTTACNKCVQQVFQWELFYETCHRSENKLKETETVKTESESSSDEESEDEFADDFLALCVCL